MGVVETTRWTREGGARTCDVGEALKWRLIQASRLLQQSTLIPFLLSRNCFVARAGI